MGVVLPDFVTISRCLICARKPRKTYCWAMATLMIWCQVASQLTSCIRQNSGAPRSFSVAHCALPLNWTEYDYRSWLKSMTDYREVLSHDHMITWGYCRFDVPASDWKRYLLNLSSSSARQGSANNKQDVPGTGPQYFEAISGEARSENGHYYRVPWWTPDEYKESTYYYFNLSSDFHGPKIRVHYKACVIAKDTYRIFMYVISE